MTTDRTRKQRRAAIARNRRRKARTWLRLLQDVRHGPMVCADHLPHDEQAVSRLSYGAAIEDAERRHRRGERQRRCSECWLWFWPGEMRRRVKNSRT